MSHGDHREEIIIEHPHAYDPGEPKGGLIAIFGVVTIVVLIVTGLAVQFYFDRYKEDQVQTKVLAVDNDALRNLRATEQKELSSYSYIDKDKGSVRIPVERAMELLIQESAAGKVKYPTTPYTVKTPEQLAGGATAPGAAPAPPAGGAVPATAPSGAGAVTPGSTGNAKPPAH